MAKCKALRGSAAEGLMIVYFTTVTVKVENECVVKQYCLVVSQVLVKVLFIILLLLP